MSFRLAGLLPRPDKERPLFHPWGTQSDEEAIKLQSHNHTFTLFHSSSQEYNLFPSGTAVLTLKNQWKCCKFCFRVEMDQTEIIAAHIHTLTSYSGLLHVILIRQAQIIWPLLCFISSFRKKCRQKTHPVSFKWQFPQFYRLFKASPRLYCIFKPKS